MRTVEAAKGRWPEILERFGISKAVLNVKGHKCPKDGAGKDRFRFTDHNGSGAYFCACSAGEKGGMGLLQCVTGKNFKELADEIDEFLGNEQEEKAQKKPTQAELLRPYARRSARSAYLASRGLEIAPGLLWATEVDYYEEGQSIGKFATMLAPVTRKGKWLTYHATYLQNGCKAQVPSPRKCLPFDGTITGGGIELYPAAKEMGVGEGIETCIAAKMLFGIPTHSAINATMLAKWEWPEQMEVLHIFADNDPKYAGIAAAWALAHRAALKDKTVHVHLPEKVGEDWNNVWLDVLKSWRNAASVNSSTAASPV